MKIVTLTNIGKVATSVMGTDDKVYYLNPRRPEPLPPGVNVKEGFLNSKIRVTISES